MTLLKVVTELVIRVVELLEAEGRVARENVTRLAVAAMIVMIGAGMLLAAVLMTCAALFIALLRAGIYPELGLLLVVFILVLMSIVCLLFGKNMATGSRDRGGTGRRKD